MRYRFVLGRHFRVLCLLAAQEAQSRCVTFIHFTKLQVALRYVTLGRFRAIFFGPGPGLGSGLGVHDHCDDCKVNAEPTVFFDPMLLSLSIFRRKRATVHGRMSMVSLLNSQRCPRLHITGEREHSLFLIYRHTNIYAPRSKRGL